MGEDMEEKGTCLVWAVLSRKRMMKINTLEVAGNKRQGLTATLGQEI